MAGHEFWMRKFLPRLVAIVTAALFVGIGVLVGDSMWRQDAGEAEVEVIQLLPGVSQQIRDFRRVKLSEDGEKVWQVEAAEASFREAIGVVEVKEASVSWNREDGNRLGLRGARGEILLEGRDIVRVELDGDLRVQLGGYEVLTDSAYYDSKADKISAPGVVRIHSDGVELSGDRMEIDLGNRTLRLQGRVSTELRNGSSSAPED